MERIRSFIAIELPPELKEWLTCLEDKLQVRQYPFVKWINPENIHLTLKFLGDVPSTSLPRITEAMSRICQQASPLNLQVGDLGSFPNWQRPQIVWVGIGQEIDKLAALQRNIDAALSPLGFPPESRSFSPHLTLGRVREQTSPGDRQRLSKWVCSHKFEDRLSFEVKAISLMRSQLTPDGAIYHQISFTELQVL